MTNEVRIEPTNPTTNRTAGDAAGVTNNPPSEAGVELSRLIFHRVKFGQWGPDDIRHALGRRAQQPTTCCVAAGGVAVDQRPEVYAVSLPTAGSGEVRGWTFVPSCSLHPPTSDPGPEPFPPPDSARTVQATVTRVDESPILPTGGPLTASSPAFAPFQEQCCSIWPHNLTIACVRPRGSIYSAGLTPETLPADGSWQGEVCTRCMRRNCVGFEMPDEIWNAVSRGRWNVLCPTCFDEEAQAAGVAYDFSHVSIALRSWSGWLSGEPLPAGVAGEDVKCRAVVTCSCHGVGVSCGLPATDRLHGNGPGQHTFVPPATPTATPAVREFTNELSNRIRITIEGPTSISESVLTPMEAQTLGEMLTATPAEEPPAVADDSPAMRAMERLIVHVWSEILTPSSRLARGAAIIAEQYAPLVAENERLCKNERERTQLWGALAREKELTVNLQRQLAESQADTVRLRGIADEINFHPLKSREQIERMENVEADEIATLTSALQSARAKVARASEFIKTYWREASNLFGGDATVTCQRNGCERYAGANGFCCAACREALAFHLPTCNKAPAPPPEQEHVERGVAWVAPPSEPSAGEHPNILDAAVLWKPSPEQAGECPACGHLHGGREACLMLVAPYRGCRCENEFRDRAIAKIAEAIAGEHQAGYARASAEWATERERLQNDNAHLGGELDSRLNSFMRFIEDRLLIPAAEMFSWRDGYAAIESALVAERAKVARRDQLNAELGEDIRLAREDAQRRIDEARIERPAIDARKLAEKIVEDAYPGNTELRRFHVGGVEVAILHYLAHPSTGTAAQESTSTQHQQEDL